MVPSVVFDVPKSSPQIDMGTPEGAPVYTIKCHRSTVIFAQARQAAFGRTKSRGQANDVDPQNNLFAAAGGGIHRRWSISVLPRPGDSPAAIDSERLRVANI